jgi:hypothetical protein
VVAGKAAFLNLLAALAVQVLSSSAMQVRSAAQVAR